MGVVHAHSWVVIDCRVPEESVIRIVSTMGTKESISYKMISHGSWYRQIERERERKSRQPSREKEEREEKQQPSQERERGEKHSRGGKKRGGRDRGVKERACRRRRVEVSEKERGEGRVRWKVSVWKKEGEKRTSKSNKQT